MSARQIIVVDVETTGLNVGLHHPVEVAWENLHTGESDVFIPPHRTGKVLAEAQVEALRINHYIDRIATAVQDVDGKAARVLARQLHGNTLAGSTPSFDGPFLRKTYGIYADKNLLVDGDEGTPEWHHRLLDLSAYAAGVLHLSPIELPGLSTVAELLDIEPEAPHTALGDVRTTATCFRRLFEMAGVELDPPTGGETE